MFLKKEGIQYLYRVKAQQIEQKLRLLEESLALAEELQTVEQLLLHPEDPEQMKRLRNRKRELEQRVREQLAKMREL